MIVIDGRDHLMGRLASVVAKNLLNGSRIVVVRCEEIVISGAIYRAQRKEMQWRHKKHLTNPTRSGPWHVRAPALRFHRVVRGMLPHKLARGAAALANLKVFDGCPAPYDTAKKLVVPDALRALRLAPGHKYCSLGAVQARMGWSYAAIVARDETKRKTEAFAWYAKRKVERRGLATKKAAADKTAAMKPFSALLQATGF